MITPEQLQEIKSIFFQHASLWKKFDIQSPYHANSSDGFSIFMTHNNEECMKQFAEAVIWPLELNQYRSSDGWAPLDERITLSRTMERVDKNALKEALDEFSQKMNTYQTISSEQFNTISVTFRKNRSEYSITDVDSEQNQIRIKFKSSRGIEAFKNHVANNWNIATYQYQSNEVTMTMSYKDGLHQFEVGALVSQLKQLNQEIAITNTEMDAIEKTFTRKLKEMNIRVKNSIDSAINALNMQIYFNSQQELDAFKQNVLIPTGCTAHSNPDNILEMKLTINRYEDALAEKNLTSLFDNMQTPFLILDTYDHRPITGSIQNNLNDLGLRIIDSIINGLTDNSTELKLPLAIINEDSHGRYVSFMASKTSYEDELFNDFASIFLRLCNKNKIDKEQGREKFYERLEPEKLNWIKYKFYISPEKLHYLLMQESSNYRGYRAGNHSIMHLANPPTTYLKANNLVCLFPVLPIFNKKNKLHILIRNAGCNFSEAISTQISELAKACLPERYGDTSIYGHHNSPIMAKLQIEREMIIQASLLCAGVKKKITKKYGLHEAQDGTFYVKLDYTHRKYLNKMDEKSKHIYSLSSVTPDELNNLHSNLFSFEVPMTVFLGKIIILLNEKAGFSGKIKSQLINQAVDHIQLIIQTIENETNNLPSENKTGDIIDTVRDNNRFFKDRFKIPISTNSQPSIKSGAAETEETPDNTFSRK